jgi:hypothetical protein
VVASRRSFTSAVRRAPARHTLTDAAQLVCAGAALFGLAALVRKTI